jgi:ankyrin repeat protein
MRAKIVMLLGTTLLTGGAVALLVRYLAGLWLFAAQATCSPVLQGHALLLRADVNLRADDGTTPLMAAAASGCGWNLLELISLGADVNAQNHYGETALSKAAARGDVAILRLLLKHGAGASVNIPDRLHKVTPLMQATIAGHTRAVRLLLQAGADLSARDFRGRTALDYAQQGTSPEHRVIARLIKYRLQQEKPKAGAQ